MHRICAAILIIAMTGCTIKVVRNEATPVPTKAVTPVPYQVVKVSIPAPKVTAVTSVPAMSLAQIGPRTVAPAVSVKKENKPGSTYDLYMVKRGDCLWNISKKVYDTPWDWPLIFRENSDMIENPNLIYIDQQLHIPRQFSPVDVKSAVAQARAFGEDK